MKRFSHIRYNKSQRIGISVLIVLLVLLELSIWLINENKKPNPITSIPQEITILQNQIDAQESAFGYSSGFKSITLQKFDPNKLDVNGWVQLGFSARQVNTILKYKKSLGGYFSGKEQIQNCYVISENKFTELEPYIVFEDLEKYTKESSIFNHSYINKTNGKIQVHYKKFNPNEYSQTEWIAIGFSEKQAATILKYKKSLGGKFTSLDQIEKCFVISEEKFREMKPFMIFPKSVENRIVKEKAESEVRQDIITRPKLQKFNPNEFSREQWMDLGFSEKQVNTLFNYKKSLGGKFKDAETLKKCYSISEEKFTEIEPYLIFE